MAGRDTLPHHLGPKEEAPRSVRRKRERGKCGQQISLLSPREALASFCLFDDSHFHSHWTDLITLGSFDLH
jgi:hypothetical protein